MTVEEKSGYKRYDDADFFDNDNIWVQNRFIINGKTEITDSKHLYCGAEVLYHIKQCELSDLIIIDESSDSSNFVVVDLTPKGHEFLGNIREDKNWKSVKEVATKIGTTSLNGFVQIASNIITEIIKHQCGLL